MPALEAPHGIVARLAGIEGVVAVSLGGSRALGYHRPDSDIDLGIYYRDASPFAIADIAALARSLNDTPDPVVTDFYRWGPWVNGGAWLTVKGRRLDFLYRSLDRIEQVIDGCRAGRIESDFYQQPPYGFHSYVYLGETAACIPLHDPAGILPALKARLEPYPPALKQAIVNRFLWAAEFDLPQTAALASHGDAYAAAGCFTRVAASLVQALYALNERYFLNDKHALRDIASFPLKPPDAAVGLEAILSCPGVTSQDLTASASRLQAFLDQTMALAAALYTRPDFRP